MSSGIDQRLEDRVSQHMSRDFAFLRVERTVGEAIREIRENPPPGRIIYFYVVDAERRLKGVVPTRALLLNSPEVPVAHIMVPNVIAIPESATVLEACEFFVLHRFLAFPVVDAERRMVGVVDVDLYTKELGEIEASERGDDLFQLIGVHLVEAQQLSSVAAFKHRFPWLLCNVVGGTIAALLSGVFQTELETLVALALFIPVVLSLAEGVSIQSVSLALQVLHGRRPTLQMLLTRLGRELRTGLLLGVASAGLVACVALVWKGNFSLGVCVLAGISGGVTFAAAFGLSLPNVLRLLNRDPQVASGPIALVGSDVVTLLIYFSVARLLLG